MAEPMSKIAKHRTLKGKFLCLMLATTTQVFAENLLDPTRPSTALGIKHDAKVSVPASGPSLQSVLISPGRKVAIISGQTVLLGERFGERRVVSITESEVILRSGKDLLILKLFPDVQKQLTSSMRTQAYVRGQ